VLDGIDGSGKTIQTRLLVDKLRREGYDTSALDFPQYDSNFFGKFIGRCLKGEFGDPTKISPYLAAIPYACDRWESSRALYEWIKGGKIVVLNRYVSANMGHQASKIQDRDERLKFLDWLWRMEYGVFGLPVPDLNILLKLEPEIAASLIGKKGKRSYLKEEKDFHEKNTLYLRETLECFLEISKMSPDTWKVVNCNDYENKAILPREEIHERVWEVVNPVLAAR